MITNYKIFKESIQPFNWSDINIDEYIEKCIDRYSYNELIETINDIDDSSELSEDEFFDYVKDIIEPDFEDIIDNIYDCVENTKTIYRAITVSDDFDYSNLLKKPIGAYWSYDKNNAEAHWGEPGHTKTLILTAEIQNSNDVDIEESILLNLDPSIGQEEKEIRMIVGSEILLISVEDDDDIIEINRIGKI